MNSKRTTCTECNQEKGCNDLLEIKVLKRLARYRYLQPAFNAILMLVFVYIIYSGLTGGQDTRFSAEGNFATIMVWDVWHPLLAFSILIVGRLWCFMCPLGAISDMFRNIGLKRKYPEKYKNLWVAVVLFIFISATSKHLFRFERNPLATALMLLSFILLLVIISIIYEKRTFCRFLCPTGLILAIFSMVSGSELRAKSKKICTEHSEKECLTGNGNGHGCPMYEFPQTMRRNSFCILCTECIKTCSKDNIRFSRRKFATDIINLKKPHLDEIFFIHSIIVILLFKIGMERAVFREGIIDIVHFIGIDRNIMAFILFIGLSITATGLMYLLNKIFIKRKYDNYTKKHLKYNYALIPLGLGIYLTENIFKAIHGVFYLISEASHPFGIEIFNFFQPVIPYESINIFQMGLVLTGSVASLWLSSRMKRDNSQENVYPGILPFAIVSLLYTAIAMRFLTMDIL
jgi:hypothetical protein